MSSPVVLADRSFNSTIVILNSVVLIQGTRFGTQAELEASEVMILMNQHFGNIDLKSRTLDWAASVVAWATDVVYQVTGSLVSSRTCISVLPICFAIVRLRYYITANPDVHEEPLRQARQTSHTRSYNKVV